MSQSMWRLISSVTPDVGALPLHLESPDGINNGGYMGPEGYSSIDLLVAGLEAYRLGTRVLNLTQFFDNHRLMLSDHWVTLSVSRYEVIISQSILEWKNYIKINKEIDLKAMLIKNAPLTFKWV